MYIKILIWLISIGVGFCAHAQRLGLLNALNPYDSTFNSSIPIFPQFNINHNPPVSQRLIPLTDFAIKGNPDLAITGNSGFSIKGRMGMLWDFTRRKCFTRIGGFVGSSTRVPLGFNSNYHVIYANEKLLFHVDPMLRFGLTPNKYFSAQIGYDRNFYGDGQRSLWLSDYGKAYPFASLRFNVGPITYQMMGQWLSAFTYQKKYNISHFVNWRITNKLSLSFFETVVFNSGDTINRRSFDPAYLNPFIILRPTEYAMGSGDNVLMGGGITFRQKKSKWYGQFIIDDLFISALKQRNKYWGNKFGGLIGWHYLNANWGRRLHLRIEASAVKPYTYSHIGSSLNYTHSLGVLAHPKGANFWELLFRGDYLRGQWGFCLETALGQKGLGAPYGGDIFAPYTLRPFDYNVVLLQGLKINQMNTRVEVRFQLNKLYKLQIFAETLFVFTSFENSKTTRIFPIVGLRTPIWNDYRI